MWVRAAQYSAFGCSVGLSEVPLDLRNFLDIRNALGDLSMEDDHGTRALTTPLGSRFGGEHKTEF